MSGAKISISTYAVEGARAAAFEFLRAIRAGPAAASPAVAAPAKRVLPAPCHHTARAAIGFG